MLGFSLERNGVLGTTLRFRPSYHKFITNGKGTGMSIAIQSPVEFHITIPYGKGSYRAGWVDKTPSKPYTSGTVSEPNRHYKVNNHGNPP